MKVTPMRKLSGLLTLLLGGTALAQPLPPPGGGLQVQTGLHPGYVAGSWYIPLFQHNAAGASWVNPTAGRIVCAYGAVAQTLTINALGAYVTTVGAGNAQWAVYTNGAWGRPSTLVVATPSVSTNAAAGQSGTVSQQLPAGGYWWCQNMDNATAIVIAFAAVSSTMQGYVGTPGLNALLATNGVGDGIFIAQTFGTWPTSFNSGTSWTITATASVPVIGFKVASIP